MSVAIGSEFQLPERTPAAGPNVTFGTDWNAWRASVMPQPPRRFRRSPRRAGLRDLSLTATEYPAGATGQGFTTGRVSLPHITSAEWHEAVAPKLPVGRSIPRLGSSRT
jgi:hypothetical protein